MGVRVYRNDDFSVREYAEAIQFWSNALGELHCRGQHDITEDELPDALKRAYNDLFFEGQTGSLRYLVETDKGFGIALLNEYDGVTAENSGLLMRPLFETLIQDAKVIAENPLFEKAEVFAGEFMGFDGCHELVVVFPADIPVEEFCSAAQALDELAYQACGLAKGVNVGQLVENASEKAASFITDAVVSVGQFAKDDAVAAAVMESDKLRSQTLGVCYGIPGYTQLSRADRNALYDLVKKSIEASYEKDSQAEYDIDRPF